MTHAVTQFIFDLHPINDVYVSEVRHYAFEGWMVHYSVAEKGTVNYDRDIIAFVEHTGEKALGLRWSHDVQRKRNVVGSQPLGDILGAAENVGSCEPSPRIQWDKSQGTHYTDTKAGRYSVRRLGKRQPFAAFLNNVRISNVPESTSLDVVRRDVEHRIIAARRIAGMTA